MIDWAAPFRQLRYPRALRVGAPPAAEPEDLDALLRALADDEPSAGLPESFARRLGNLVWRLRERAESLPDGDDATWISKRLELLERMLNSQNLEIVDFTGQEYDPDETWDDAVSDGHPLTHPVIAHMHEPRLILAGVVIQWGTPIVEEGRTT